MFNKLCSTTDEYSWHLDIEMIMFDDMECQKGSFFTFVTNQITNGR